MQDTIDTSTLRLTLKSQYHAGLAMLHEAIERCSDDVWLSTQHRNAFWQIAYHTLFFTHLYLHSGVSAFRPWKEHQFVSLRHLQHHSAQLADRLRAAMDIGIRWVGAGHRK
jgi:hypothetical protein